MDDGTNELATAPVNIARNIGHAGNGNTSVYVEWKGVLGRSTWHRPRLRTGTNTFNRGNAASVPRIAITQC